MTSTLPILTKYYIFVPFYPFSGGNYINAFIYLDYIPFTPAVKNAYAQTIFMSQCFSSTVKYEIWWSSVIIP